MSLLVLRALTGALLVSTAASLRTRGTCDGPEVAMAKVTMKACMTNWRLKEKNINFWEAMNEGCWKLQAYNTDKFLSSTLFRNEETGQCAVGFSGYHGRLAGYARGIAALVWPPETWNICGQDVYAPFVRLLRHHLNLGNWSKMVNLFAGPNPICKGELMFGAESMGGTGIEMLASCANAGRLHELQDAALPGYRIETLYTYGSPAGSVQPLKNTLRQDGCFKGKRIFFARDPVSHFGAFFNLKHPHQDAVQIWPGSPEAPPSIKVSKCLTDDAVTDRHHVRPPTIETNTTFKWKMDRISHEITSYLPTISFLKKNGHEEEFQVEPLGEEAPTKTYAGSYLALLQEGLQKL